MSAHREQGILLRGKPIAGRKPNSGDPQQRYQHFLELARMETVRGDMIAAENFNQHAEHFYRSMRAST